MVRPRKTRQRRRHVRRQTRRLRGGKWYNPLSWVSKGKPQSSSGITVRVPESHSTTSSRRGSDASVSSIETKNPIYNGSSTKSRPGSMDSQNPYYTIRTSYPESKGSTPLTGPNVYTINPISRRGSINSTTSRSGSVSSSDPSIESSALFQPQSLTKIEPTGVTKKPTRMLENVPKLTTNAQTMQLEQPNSVEIRGAIKELLATKSKINGKTPLRNRSEFTLGKISNSNHEKPSLKQTSAPAPFQHKGISTSPVNAHYNRGNGISHTIWLNPNHREVEWVLNRPGRIRKMMIDGLVNKLTKLSIPSEASNLSHLNDDGLTSLTRMIEQLDKLQNEMKGGNRTRKHKKRTVNFQI